MVSPPQPRVPGRLASPPPGGAAGLVLRFAPLGLALGALGVSVAATPFRHDLPSLAFFGLLYVAFFTFLWEGVRLLARVGTAGALTGGALLGLVLALQLRWDAELLVGRASLAVFVLGFALGLVLLLRTTRARERERARPGARAALALGGAGVLTGALLLLAFQGDRTLRWHLLKHHRVLGHGAYALFSRPLRIERDELWRTHGRLVEPWERADEIRTRADGRPGAPHVVFVLVDTLRADSLAAWGGDPALMPFANELAGRSVVLRDVRANASWTRASVASIFTGLLPEEHGAARYHDRLAAGWHTLPERLSEAGYRTAAFVSNWVQVGVETGFDQGFDAFFELQGAEDRSVRARYARAAELNASVLAWLDETASERGDTPVFLYLHYLDPHSPYLAGAEPGLEGDSRVQKIGAYRQELRYLDGELRALAGELEARLRGPTAWVLTSDHGEEFWEHGGWGHGHTLYRELTWVPALVHLPGDLQRGVSDARLELRDLYELVLELAHPQTLDVLGWAARRSRGTRYASQYLDRVADVRPDAKRTALRSVEEGELELIWSAYGPTWQLYDLASDPLELANRAGARDADVDRLAEALERAAAFWTRTEPVERSAQAIEFLQDLGYAGGVHEEDTN